jgi:hypothetical protein
MALTAAAALASRSPFLSPPDAREAADRARSHFAGILISQNILIAFA